MNLYPGSEHLLIHVACGDPFLDIRIACGDSMVEAMMKLNDGVDGEPSWPFAFSVPYRPRENVFAWAFPVANQDVHVTEFGDMPSRRRLVAALIACGARKVTYRTAEEEFTFYPENFEDLFHERVHQSGAHAGRAAKKHARDSGDRRRVSQGVR